MGLTSRPLTRQVNVRKESEMPEYIERETAVCKFERFRHDCEAEGDTATAEVFLSVICELQDIPTADVAPVVYAHWENVRGNDKVGVAIGTCSHCHQEAWANYELTPRCPYCGAMMDGGSKENT